MSDIDKYLETEAGRFEDELCSFLRIPSISADPRREQDMHKAAEWVAGEFRGLGFETEVVATEGHPLVYAESPRIEGAPTALVYGHYDVQPPEPLELWTSPPFEPTKREGNLYARGATDDKGQLFTHVKSAEAWIKVEGRLPINLKFLIEGEEEVGSENVEKFIAENPRRLACDCVVVSDSAQLAPGMPAITYGLRGIVYYELRLTGPNRDLHSGSFGGSISNPANALAGMLAKLVDDSGRVLIPGFYDDVVPLTDQERGQFATLPFDEKEYLEQIGVDTASGEQGYSTLERRWARPTFDVSGLWSGYQGEGAKTVLPSTAGAKFSFRLVPNQDPDRITEALRTVLAQWCPPGIKMELIVHHGAPGVLVPLDSPYIEAAAVAIEQAFGRRPYFAREGGSIPIVATLHDTLQADTLLLGWGQNDDNTHSPNEKFCLADFHLAIKASARLWAELAKK